MFDLLAIKNELILQLICTPWAFLTSLIGPICPAKYGQAFAKSSEIVCCLTINGNTGNEFYSWYLRTSECTKQRHQKQSQSIKNSYINAKVSTQILTLYCPLYCNNTA